ncbi:MAG: beta-L-arabinofuranosidase domain-containing protein [Verrucomicrobiota bacterium]
MKTTFDFLAISILLGLTAAAAGEGPRPTLAAVPFNDVKVEDTFWAPRIQLNREKVLPHNFKYCETTGRINNFAKAAGQMPGPFQGIYFDDSDVYKVIEGAAYSLAQQRDAALEKTVDGVIAKIAAAQLPDGYLYTFYTVNKELDKRWSNEKDMHETYCAGHLIEAAVAYFQATGKRTLLEVALRLADHLDSVFGPAKKHEVPGHQEIELALVKLWRVTGQERYLKLAQFFIEERGRYCGRKIHGDYNQDHLPVAEQREITGHAVRAMYLYAGVADLAAITGNPDYITTMDHIWRDVTQRKMYITGGIGPSAHNEGFTVPYDLPNDSAYAETCASIGMALWNQRMALLHADAKYADVVERVIYNGALSGVSLDGEKFFYVNPLASRGRHHRQSWFGCACCPVNVVRFLPTVGGYAYAYDNQGIYVNQYLASRGTVALKGQKILLTQETRYPWEGAVKLTLDPAETADFTLHLRIPGWLQGAPSPEDLYVSEGQPESGAMTLKVNGQAVRNIEVEKGYARLNRAWKKGDQVELEMPMSIQRIKANPKVKADIGRVALQRGPVVYCLEGVDNENNVRSLALPPEAKLTAEFRSDLLGGVSVIKGTALACSKGADAPKPFQFAAVPYYAWDNRQPGEMVVWLPEDPALAEPKPLPTVAGQSTVSASHKHGPDVLEALNDQVEPANSHDHGIPRFTWWDHRGTTEWVQYDFGTAKKIAGVEVYWFEDAGTGQCRVPKSWRLSYKDGSDWKPVQARSDYAAKVDQFNRVTFEPVQASAVRLEVELQPGFSGGVLEWRVLE